MADILTANTLNRVINQNGTRKVLAQSAPTTSKPGDVVTLLTTDGNTTHEIQDISLMGIGKSAILKINDSVITTGEDDSDNLVLEGKIFMDVNSTMTVTIVGDEPRFDGVHFTNTSGPSACGMEIITANGKDANQDDPRFGPRRASSRNHTSDDACSLLVDGKIRHFRIWDNAFMASYTSTGMAIQNRGDISISHGLTAGEGYVWGCLSGSNSVFQRFHPKTLQRTRQTVYGAQYLGKVDNQGSYFLYYYDEAAGYGKLFGKSSGGSTSFSVIHLDKSQQDSSGQWYCELFSDTSEYVAGAGAMNATGASLSVGGYSDGACIVKTREGTNYLVEIGSDNWTYLNLDTGILNRVNEGSSSSTEYGENAAQVAPGFVVCYGEQSDRVMTFDLNGLDEDGNVQTPYRMTNDDNNPNPWSWYYEYGEISAFTGWLSLAEDVTHTSYITGVEYKV